jgi:hypothetical protein
MTLLSRDKDPLFFAFAEHDDVLVPYHWNDGAVISLGSDDCGLFLNGRRFSVFLSPGSPGLEWILNSDSKKISQLRTCVLGGPAWEDLSPMHKAIQKISKIRPDMAWVIDGKRAFRQVLDLFDPRWLFITSDTKLNREDLSRIAGEPNLNYLWFNVKNLNTKKDLPLPETLHTLVIEDWKPEHTGLLPGKLKSLRSLTIKDSTLRDLSGISVLKGLDELHLISCSELADIHEISNLSSLKALTLTDCQMVPDLSVLKDMKGLQWLGFPPGTSQDQFNQIIKTHPDIRVIELVECKNIKDLTSLRTLSQLESLVLLNGPTNYAPLHEFKNLRFLALSKEAFKEAVRVRAFQETQPDCLVVQAQPFCLGSGWILTLWPALLISWFLAHRRSKRSLFTDRKDD